MAVPQIGQNLHELDWQKLHETYLRSAVVGQYNRLEAEQPLTQTSFRLAADPLSCALPRVPHFGDMNLALLNLSLVVPTVRTPSSTTTTTLSTTTLAEIY